MAPDLSLLYDSAATPRPLGFAHLPIPESSAEGRWRFLEMPTSTACLPWGFQKSPAWWRAFSFPPSPLLHCEDAVLVQDARHHDHPHEGGDVERRARHPRARGARQTARAKADSKSSRRQRWTYRHVCRKTASPELQLKAPRADRAIRARGILTFFNVSPAERVCHSTTSRQESGRRSAVPPEVRFPGWVSSADRRPNSWGSSWRA